MSRKWRQFFLILVLASSSGIAAPAPIQTLSVLLIGDIHFDPFDDEAIIGQLMRAEAARWDGIFKKSTKKGLLAKELDTNYALLDAALQAMQKTIPRPDLIVITGDFLRHKFNKKLALAMAAQSAQGSKVKPYAAAFAGKTIQFLATFIQQKFPNTQIVPVLGNNDSSCGNYQGQDAAFLRAFASAWEPAVNLKSGSPDFVTKFVRQQGDYTAVLAPLGSTQKIKLVVRNNVFGSRSYHGKCVAGKLRGNPQSLPWLESELSSSQERGEKVWLIEHIPAGMDVAATLFAHPEPCRDKAFVMMFDDKYNANLLKILRKYAANIALSLVGHTHANEFRIYDSHFPTLFLPSIGPNHGNNPSFEVLTLSQKTVQPQELTAYTMDYSAAVADPQTDSWRAGLKLKEHFAMPDLSVVSFEKLREGMRDDSVIKGKFGKYLNSGATAPAFYMDNWKAYVCGINQLERESYIRCACE